MADLFLQYSYLGITLLLILTGCGLPIPEEVPIIYAGVTASLGGLNPWGAFAACLIGALLGDCVLYSIGYHFGHNLVNRHPHLARLLHANREAEMEKLIDQHGLKVLFVARFLVLVRGPVYLTIGILRQPFRKFIMYDAICATAVVSLFFGVSYIFGRPVAKWIREGEVVLTALVLTAVLVIGIVLWVKRKRIALLLGTPLDSLGCDGAKSAGGSTVSGPISSDDSPAPANGPPPSANGHGAKSAGSGRPGAWMETPIK